LTRMIILNSTSKNFPDEGVNTTKASFGLPMGYLPWPLRHSLFLVTMGRGFALHLAKGTLIVSSIFAGIFRESTLMLPFGSGLRFLITLTWTMSPLIGPTVSMVTQLKNCNDMPIQGSSCSELPPLRVLTCGPDHWEIPALAFFILSTKLLLHGSPSAKTVETATWIREQCFELPLNRWSR
jgi:hypothetical protein